LSPFFQSLRYNRIRRSKEDEIMIKNARINPVFIFLALVLAACNLPSSSPDEEGADAILTAAAETVEANLTEAAVLNPPTIPPLVVNTSTPTSTQLPAPTNLPPTATNTSICDLASFIKDVTVADGTEFEPNENFTKTWQLENIGTCTWSGYTLVFDSGDAMSGPASLPVGSVSPGQEVDLSVDLKAPGSDGSYRGYWRIKNNTGVLIPVANGYQGKSFFVDIKVKTPPPTSTTVTLSATGGSEGGTVYEPASGSAPVLGSILAGDTAADFLARGYMSFDISALSGKTIISATLDISSCTALNNPYTDLGGIWVGELQYGLPLDQSDYNLLSAGIVKLTAAPGNAIDVKSYLQTRVTEGKNRFQIRLYPDAGSSDGDGQSDYVLCGATSPKLTITYQP
jgi:hypothetical protein